MGIPPSTCFSDNRKNASPTEAPFEAQALPVSDRGVGTPSPMGAGGGRGVPAEKPEGGVGVCPEGGGGGYPPCLTLGGNHGFRSEFHGKWREKEVQEGGRAPPTEARGGGGYPPS